MSIGNLELLIQVNKSNMKRKKYTEKEKEQILKEFANKLISNQKDIPEDMRLSDEDFWKCLY
jgi:hypothetical protein